MNRIEILTFNSEAPSLHSYLDSHNITSLPIECTPTVDTAFGIDPEIAKVVVMSAAGIVASILSYYAGRHARTIKIECRNAIKIEFPADTPWDQVEKIRG